METMNNPLHNLVHKVVENKRNVLTTLVGAAVIAAMIAGYMYNMRSREAHAHRTWVRVLKEYYNAPISGTPEAEKTSFSTMIFNNTQEKWEQTAKEYAQAYEAHAGTKLAPFFLVMQAQALEKIGQVDKALPVLEQAVHAMSAPQVKDAYHVKLALMQIDSSDETIQQKGIATLQDIAGQDDHVLHDYALYRLGSYYWTRSDYDNVKNYWKMLMLKYSDAAQTPSPWAASVKERLNLIESV